MKQQLVPISPREWKELARLRSVRRLFVLTRRMSGRNLAGHLSGFKLMQIQGHSSAVFILLSDPLLGRGAIAERSAKGRLILTSHSDSLGLVINANERT